MSNLAAVPPPDSAEKRSPRGRLVVGLGQAIGGNATAFGYSVTITASFGAVELVRGSPTFWDLLVFGLGSVVAFGGLEGLISKGFRNPLPKGSDDVVLLGTSMAVISILLAIAAARGVAGLFTGTPAWFCGALCGSLVFALVESLEFIVAEWIQERRGESDDPTSE